MSNDCGITSFRDYLHGIYFNISCKRFWSLYLEKISQFCPNLDILEVFYSFWKYFGLCLLLKEFFCFVVWFFFCWLWLERNFLKNISQNIFLPSSNASQTRMDKKFKTIQNIGRKHKMTKEVKKLRQWLAYSNFPWKSSLILITSLYLSIIVTKMYLYKWFKCVESLLGLDKKKLYLKILLL